MCELSGLIKIGNKKKGGIASLLCCFFLLLSSISSFGQASDTLKKKEIFFGVGPAAYKGDLGGSYEKNTLIFNIGIKFNRFKKINGNFNLSIGEVTGQQIGYSFDDGTTTSPTPNSFFVSKLIGLNYELHYNFINKEKFKLYISQGIGILRFNPKNDQNQNLVDLTSSRALGEVYGNVSIFFPTQIGALYYLPNDFSFGIQMGFWGTATDYLDNISQWSTSSGNDNIFSARFEVHIPVSF